MDNSNLEYWLRGPVDGIPDLLQPAAHALLQTRLESRTYTKNVDSAMLWKTPYGRASVGFHLQHISGVIDRMMSYAKAMPLTEQQLIYLKSEGKADSNIQLEDLLSHLELKTQEMLSYFKELNGVDLTELRTVGRKELPSTLQGVLFHAAEHGQRHIGQLLVTVSILKAQ
jgi:uncharacterized damage-inducible protein DinB